MFIFIKVFFDEYMYNMKNFLRKTILGGLTVVLPLALLAMVFNWLFVFLTDLIQPLTNLLMKYGIPEIVSDGLVFLAIILVCFGVGLFELTKLGKWLVVKGEENVLTRLPGYQLIKEVILQFLGEKTNPFNRVGLAKLFSNDTMVTVFITDEHDYGYTVFMPTGPNPTSGNIYHLKKEQVEIIEDASVELSMRSIIACGAGSEQLFKIRDKNSNND